MKTKQTFEPEKTITELGIDTTKKFEVMKDSNMFQKGDILELYENDNTNCPEFKNQDGRIKYINLSKLAYAYEEIKPGDIVGVSDESQEEANEDLKSDRKAYYVGKSRYGGFIVEYRDRSCGYWNFMSNKKLEEEPEEMTLEQICKELGKDIKIIKTH